MSRENKVNERLGFCGVNHQGSKFRVVHYKNYDNIWIEFYNHTREQITIVKTQWKSIQNKSVMDIYFPSIYGVGYMGETTSVNEDGTLKESYNKWMNMLTRCYDSKYLLKYPTYVGCSVCKEWECFANFEKDYESLLNENNFSEDIKLALDKDIIIKGNKVYSKKTCILIPSKLNNMFTKCDKNRGSLPIGISYDKKNKTNPYRARVRTGLKTSNHKESYYLSKYFSTPQEAFEWYKEQKEQVIKSVADEYVALGYITKESRLFKALMSYEVEIDD